jgi:putative chitinase
MLNDASKFFSSVRSSVLGPDLSQGEVSGCEAIIEAMEGCPLSWTAYALATAYRETASTMQPISEFGGSSYFTRMYDVQGARRALAISEGNTTPGDGIKYRGRGYVQLTWKANYARASRELAIDLVEHPDLAMAPNIAAKIMRRGMEQGWFTGKSFHTYLPGNFERAAIGPYTQSRRIINGLDHADEIAHHAIEFENALVDGGWH